MSFEGDHNLQNLFGEDSEPRKGADGSGLPSDPNITPSILLEQLAYVDNFMPDLDNELTSFGSLLDGEAQSGALGMDERLAAELSAFADDTFIFPDENKPQDPDRNDALGGGDQVDVANAPAYPRASSAQPHQRNSHFLTQRRNNFLASQYDYSRQRFSSKNRRRSADQSPVDDHGGFTNVDITEGQPALFGQTGQPYITSPLSNLVATASNPQSQQPYSISNTPSSNPNTITESSSVVTPFMSNVLPHAPAPEHPPQQRQQSVGQIHMPDYSSIPTSTLIALLPKIGVPPGAYRSLLNVGFEPDQIDAIAAIIAYYQTRKLNTTETTQRATALPEGNPASFLLQALQSDNTSRSTVPALSTNLREDSGPSQGSHDMGNANFAGDASASFFHSLLDMNNAKQEPSPGADSGGQSGSSSSQSEKPSTPETERFSTGLEHSSHPPTTDSKDAIPRQALPSDEKASKEQQKPHLKRKLKEQELEKSIQELSELAMSLQQRIHTLEMENRLLKNLVMERGELKGIEEVENVRRELIKKISEESGKADAGKPGQSV